MTKAKVATGSALSLAGRSTMTGARVAAAAFAASESHAMAVTADGRREAHDDLPARYSSPICSGVSARVWIATSSARPREYCSLTAPLFITCQGRTAAGALASVRPVAVATESPSR